MSAISQFGSLTKGFAIEAVQLYFEPITPFLERLVLSRAQRSSLKIARQYMRALDEAIGKIDDIAPSALLVANFNLLTSALKQFYMPERDVFRHEIAVMLFNVAQLHASQGWFSRAMDSTYWSHRLQNESPEAGLSAVAEIFSIMAEFYRVEGELRNAELALLAAARLYQYLAYKKPTNDSQITFEPPLKSDVTMRTNPPAIYLKEASKVLRRLSELYVQRAELIRSSADAMTEESQRHTQLAE